MALNDYRDIECDVNGTTTPHEKAKLRTEVERLSVVECMQEFWHDYEAGQNPGVIRTSDYTTGNLK